MIDLCANGVKLCDKNDVEFPFNVKNTSIIDKTKLGKRCKEHWASLVLTESNSDVCVFILKSHPYGKLVYSFQSFFLWEKEVLEEWTSGNNLQKA